MQEIRCNKIIELLSLNQHAQPENHPDNPANRENDYIQIDPNNSIFTWVLRSLTCGSGRPGGTSPGPPGTS